MFLFFFFFFFLILIFCSPLPGTVVNTDVDGKPGEAIVLSLKETKPGRLPYVDLYAVSYPGAYGSALNLADTVDSST